METNQLLDLTECTEFRQRLEAKTPPAARIVMATLLLLCGAALLWATVANASLVVIAPGRVRPTESPNRVYSAVSLFLEGRVVEAFVKEGDQVNKGDVLLRLDTSLIDNEIARQTYAIEAGSAELAELHRLILLLDERTKVAKEQAAAGNRSRGAVKRTVENRALRQSQASGNNSRVRAVRLSGIEKQAGPR